MGQVKVDCTPISVQQLSATEIRQMYELFEQHYECVSFETFCKDLFKKDKVIVAREPSTWDIKGFTTIKIITVDYELDGKRRTATGIFSGDTILSPELWGQRVMNGVFASVLLREKLKRPFSEFYWFLISKGYKTYLLLTNNFSEYYPNRLQPTPAHIQRIMDGYATQLYPGAYDQASGLLRFEESLGQLRATVAPISQELMESHPNIAFFQQKNPDWQRGQELVCLGVINWRLFLFHILKSLRFVTRSWLKRARARLERSEA